MKIVFPNRRILDLLYTYFMREHGRVLAQLRVKVAFDALSEHEQGKVYAEHVGSTSLARFLHLARRGELNAERLRRIFKRPEHARGFAVHSGVVTVDSSIEGGNEG